MIKVVTEKLGEKIMTSILKDINLSEESLWGMNRTIHFPKDLLFVALYKDLFNVGYCKLCDTIKEFLKMTPSTLQHNVQVMRKRLRDWSEKIILPSEERVLRAISKGVHGPPPFDKVTLWMDSSDFRTSGKKSIRRKDPRWSYKCNSPGRRWLVVSDAHTKTQAVFGPYNPKDYDADIAIDNREYLETNFEGQHAVADGHYTKCDRFFKKMKVFAPYAEQPEARRLKPKTISKIRVALRDQKKADFNKNLRRVRGRCEGPFGWQKEKFAALNQPFAEDEEQHDCLIRLSLACHRIMKT